MWQEEMIKAIETLKSFYGSVQQSGGITNISLEDFHRIVPTWSKKFVLNIYTKESGVGYLVFRETCSSNLILILRRLERLLPLFQTFENLGLNVTDLVYGDLKETQTEVTEGGFKLAELNPIREFSCPSEVNGDFVMYQNLLVNWIEEKVVACWSEENQRFEKTTKKFTKSIKKALGL